MIFLKAQQELFAQGIADGKPATHAYRAAGYSCKNDKVAEACSSRLLGNAKVRARIDELLAQKARAVGIDKKWVLEQLLQQYDRAKEFANGLPAANKALELIGKEIGMFVDRKVTLTSKLEGMSDEQLDDLVEKLSTALGVAGSGDGSAATGNADAEPAQTGKPH